MNNEAPETIFLTNPELDDDGWNSKYVNCLIQTIPRQGLLSVEYIRKDVYDEAQARIKELEDCIKSVLSIKLKDGSLIADRVKATALAKESE